MLEIERDLVPLSIGVFVVVNNLVPEPSEKNADLDGPACNQIVETNGAPRVVL